MPIVRRIRLCTTAYGVQCTTAYGVQHCNTIFGSTQSCSSDDGHNDARNMLR